MRLQHSLARALFAIVLALALGGQPGPALAEPAGDDRPGPMAVFWEGWLIVNNHFLERSRLERERLLIGATIGVAEGALESPGGDARRLAHRAIRGLVRTLGDPNTVFLTPEERRVTITGFAGHLEGIGACLELRDGRPTVSGLVGGSPAERAGLRRGDSLLAVDDRPTDALSLRDVVLAVRGPSGSPVRLRTRGAELTVERAEVRLPSARGMLLEPGIGLLRVVAFTESTDEEVGAALDDLANQGARALVVDLRGNLGGLLRPAVAVASRLTPVDPPAWQEDGHGRRYAYERPEGRTALDWPLVVLADNWTASASEVLALALRDTGRATIVGRATYGKDTIQYLFELSDGSGLHITAARWLGPSGRPLDPGGLAPDVWSVTTAGADADAALDEALRLLRPLVEADGLPAGSPLRIEADDCSPTAANAV